MLNLGWLSVQAILCLVTMNLCLVDLKVMLSVIVKTGSAHPQLLSHLHHVIAVRKRKRMASRKS